MSASARQNIPRRVGLMGGSFDPIHNGHIFCAQQAYEQLALDEVVFIPAGTPSFKRDCKLATREQRLEMTRLAVDGHPGFGVSSIEVDREGITYTVDTLRELVSAYEAAGTPVELFFIVGTDSAATLHTWHEAPALADLATFVVVTRPGCSFEPEAVSASGDIAFRFVVLEGAAPDISSTGIRATIAAGSAITGLVPEAVERYILDQGLYYEKHYPSKAKAEGKHLSKDINEYGGIADDPLCRIAHIEPFIAGRWEQVYRDAYDKLKERLGSKRFCHAVSVSHTAWNMAKVYGVDPDDAAIAGLLHDWDKCYDDAGQVARALELGIDLGPDPDPSLLGPLLHARTGAVAVSREYPELPQHIIDAIAKHTTGALEMSKLDMIIYSADLIEPLRTLPISSQIAARVGELDLESIYFLCYEGTMYRLVQRRRTFDEMTIRIWNEMAPKYRFVL